MIRVEKCGLLRGSSVGRNGIIVSYLQFADGTIFSSKAYSKELETLKLLLLVFGRCSGLKVYLNKSTLSIVNVNEDQLKSLMEILECKVVEWPTNIWDSL